MTTMMVTKPSEHQRSTIMTLSTMYDKLSPTNLSFLSKKGKAPSLCINSVYACDFLLQPTNLNGKDSYSKIWMRAAIWSSGSMVANF
jgi:hypothetical protein